MPELPDVVVYIEALESRILGQTLERVRLASPFLLRTISPALAEVEGRAVREVRRIGKRIAIGLDEKLWLVLHPVISGRLDWGGAGVEQSAQAGLAPVCFFEGTVLLT